MQQNRTDYECTTIPINKNGVHNKQYEAICLWECCEAIQKASIGTLTHYEKGAHGATGVSNGVNNTYNR